MVSAKEWKKQYGIETFLNNHNVEYLLSFSNDEKVLDGVLNVELPNDNLEIRVSDSAMIVLCCYRIYLKSKTESV